MPLSDTPEYNLPYSFAARKVILPKLIKHFMRNPLKERIEDFNNKWEARKFAGEKPSTEKPKNMDKELNEKLEKLNRLSFCDDCGLPISVARMVKVVTVKTTQNNNYTNCEYRNKKKYCLECGKNK